MNDSCIFCNNPIHKKMFCETHTKIFIQQLKFINSKKLNIQETKEYYHNLKHSIMRTGTIEVVVDLSIRLIAIGYIDYKKTNNLCLFDKALFDAKNLYSSKVTFLNKIDQVYQNYKSGSLNDFNVREKWPANFLTSDGHKVRSLGELFIDNWLYTHKYLHRYEKKVYYDEERFFLSDFYLENEDIYIEYCGKKDQEYLIKKKAQKKLYESLNYNVIYVDYSDLKMFDDFFEEKIRKLL